MRTIKVYKINRARLITEILLCAVGMALLWYFNDFLFKFFFYESLVVFAVLIGGLIVALTRCISQVEFDGNHLKINYLLFGTKTFDFSTIKDFSVANNFRIVRLYYIDNQKPTIIRLFYFTNEDRAKITDNIAAIMEVFFLNYSEEQLDQFYEDKNQYNFTATEKHIPIFVMLSAMLGFATLVSSLLIALVLIFPPNQDISSVIEMGPLWVFLISWIIVLVLDAFLPKRTLTSENGVITLSRKGKIIYTFRAKDVFWCDISYKKFLWYLKKSPKKEYLINLMGFSRKEKRVFRNKLELLLNAARE
jgi:hypothetical protein